MPLSLNVETIVAFSRFVKIKILASIWASLMLHDKPVYEDFTFWVLINPAGNDGAEEVEGC